MTKELIQKSIDINAPRGIVWDVLLNDQHTRNWYAEFQPGSHAVTDWQEGHKATFLDGKGNGIFGTVIANKNAELISIEYSGSVSNGEEDYDSEMAQAIKGAKETYRLTPSAAGTRLNIELDMASEYAPMMSEAWDRALQKVKSIAESIRTN